MNFNFAMLSLTPPNRSKPRLMLDIQYVALSEHTGSRSSAILYSAEGINTLISIGVSSPYGSICRFSFAARSYMCPTMCR
jgi:hypothetical protein